MSEQVFVISDLHLGGAPGFQMCGPAGQGLLANFTRWVTTQQAPGRDAHIVVAGDGVDFLAEGPSAAFTVDEAEAARKLASIFEHTWEVWDAFRAHVAAGGKFTLMLGNHDIELSLPKVRRRLLQRLGVGRVEILYDDEALRMGPLLVEHGNRYDDWNWVDHDQLRHVRRNLSRGEEADFFKPQPGSNFVINIMNEMKQKYPFVDLLKPETESVMPFMALLRPDLIPNMKSIGATAREWIAMRLRVTDFGGDSDRALGGAPEAAIAARMKRTDRMMGHLDALVPGQWQAAAVEGDARSWLGDGARLAGLFAAKGDPEREHLEKLRSVLIDRLGRDGRGFDVNSELATYRDAATNAATNGASVVVYGHTHLVKRVALSGNATYLNTGTWADLMRVPVKALSAGTPDDEALRELGEFAKDLEDRQRVEKWRRQVPTFARIDLADDLSLRAADVHLYRDGASLEGMSIPDGPLDF